MASADPIPVDPYYLAWKTREYDFHMDFIELAARVNDAMPYDVVTPSTTIRRSGKWTTEGYA